MTAARIEAKVWNEWYPIAALDSLAGPSWRAGPSCAGPHLTTRLLGHDLVIAGPASVTSQTLTEPIHVRSRHGMLWACLGEPAGDVLEFPLCHEPDRWVVTGGAIQVAVSGLRAVENFLDMGHLSFVHTGYLGIEPYTEIRPYRVASRDGGGIVASDCRMYQPLASPVAETPLDVDYVYEVLRPFCVVLYKTNPAQPQRKDFIALLVQPVDEEHCVAHSLLAYLRDGIDAAGIRSFMQLIFCQDKPILENQLPKRLPLDPRAETAVRSDAASAAYRRWLQEAGVRYGAA